MRGAGKQKCGEREARCDWVLAPLMVMEYSEKKERKTTPLWGVGFAMGSSPECGTRPLQHHYPGSSSCVKGASALRPQVSRCCALGASIKQRLRPPATGCLRRW